MAMGDCEFGITELEKEEDIIAAAKQISRALGSRKSLTDEARKILSDLGTQLSSISILKETEPEESGCEIETRLDSVQEKLMSWEADQSMIWESSFDDGFEYLTLVGEATSLTERLDSLLCSDDRTCELQRRAHDVLQTAMDRLEEEFRHLLANNQTPFEPDHLDCRSGDDDTHHPNPLEEASILSLDEIPAGESFNRENSLAPSSAAAASGRLSDDLLIEPVTPEAVPELRAIAEAMLRAKYDRECSEAFTSLRKDALAECLSALEAERLSIEDVIRAEWGSLNSRIKKWIRAVNVFVRVCLPSERRLCDRLFDGDLDLSRHLFVESSRSALLQLLNFGEAMSVGPQRPEKLSRVLDMYEALSGLSPDIEALYGPADPMADECREVLARLGHCVRATFLEFRNAIASNPSNAAVASGGIHPLTRYVMNYIRTLTDYGETLDSLFDDGDDSGGGGGGRFESLTEALERNLEAKSALYRDASLQHLFLMNNIHYMAQKVKGPELRAVFGDDWIRKRNGKFQQQAIDYQRSSWGSILALLKEEGSTSVSKAALKERFKSFYASFEEVYRTQTAWTIPDEELREDLRISTSLNVIQAYRIFEGRHFNHISDKYIKYNADDLERCLLDLFEGSPKTLQSQSRR